MPPRSKKSSKEPPANLPPCAEPGCTEGGEFKAPYSPTELQKYRWFCLTHVREYNAKWNYFAEMSDVETEQWMRDAPLGHRPTWKVNSQKLHTRENLEEALHAMLHGTRQGFKEDRRKRAEQQRQSDAERKTLTVLELEGEVPLQAIKKQYKLLVKKYHPDVNKGDKKAEEQFKVITAAYHELLKLRAKKDKQYE